MTTLLFEGSPLLLQGALFDDYVTPKSKASGTDNPELQRFSAAIRRAFAAYDNEGALLVVEATLEQTLTYSQRTLALEQVLSVARQNTRRTDLIEKLDHASLAICLPGAGRIGMTRVADAIRQMIWSSEVTVTIGAVHTTESAIVDIDELLLAARVNLDSARTAGGNRTNWSDFAIEQVA